MTWQHFEHEADIGLEGIAATLAGAFEQAALAMTAVVTDPQRVADAHKVEICCEAPDHELLLADWLNALIYEMATRRMLFARYEVSIEDHRLLGHAWGEPVSISKHRPAVEVKGATYTALSVRQDEAGNWHARCVVDV
jgi:tRNA nucleotidyltransferase (CCA-adding enzyme)